MAAARQRIEQQPGWILHTQPWRETSLIVEVCARDYGRVALVAKGARRPHSQLRGVLMAFQPLLIDWSGGGEVKTLVRAEWQGGQRLLSGRALLCGFYLNELLLRLTAREDPHPGLFEAYAGAVRALGAGAPPSPALRRFELALLRELGYEAGLSAEVDGGGALDGDADYVYEIERGLRRVVADDGAAPASDEHIVVSGRTLLDIAANDFSRAETLLQSKLLLRALIQHTLGAQSLQTRRIFRELHEL